MKKQILTLAMCLALSTTSAMAEVTKTITKTNTKTAVTTTITNPTIKPANGITLGKPGEQIKLMNRDEARKFFEAQKAKERELLYSALNLSIEQKTKAEALDTKTRAEAGKYLRKVQLEARKLRDLKTKHASFFALYKQKMALKRAKADANNYFAESRKSFEAILTKEQKEIFKLIDDAKRAEMDKFRKEHAPKGMGPKGPRGPEPMGPPPEKK